MNPLTNVRNIAKLNEQELKYGIFDHRKSWHSQYKDSAYIFIGGLPYELSEGDILCVFSQYGEIVNINLVRDKKSGKSKGYGFLAYEDQKSTILAVDNFNGIKLGGRTIRVDHVEEYRRPKGDEKDEKGKFKEKEEKGCAPQTPPESEEEESDLDKKGKKKKAKKVKKKKKKKKDNKSEKRNGEEGLEKGESMESSGGESSPEEVSRKHRREDAARTAIAGKDKHRESEEKIKDKYGRAHSREKEDSKKHYSREERWQVHRDDRKQSEYSRSRNRNERQTHERPRDHRGKRSRSRSPPYRR
ncbi:RNA-binding motif protein, X-linked 2-like [Rhopilema esculentum]|uniref:RNA-binding motif protein, X-linked 2-like n=1 Tax=Rhopilema esculentum TaxID=499914 RepID=UPI0031D93547